MPHGHTPPRKTTTKPKESDNLRYYYSPKTNYSYKCNGSEHDDRHANDLKFRQLFNSQSSQSPKPSRSINQYPQPPHQSYYQQSQSQSESWVQDKQKQLSSHLQNTSQIVAPIPKRPNHNSLQIIKKWSDENEWITENRKASLVLNRRESYVNPSVTIHYLDEETMKPYEVFIIYSNGHLSFVDRWQKTVNIENGLFVIRTNGKMYITPDRDDPNRVILSDKSVICHCSFDSIVFFGGLITVHDGFPTNICNQSGTFFPDMIHTVRIRNILAKIFKIHPQNITINFVIEEEIFEKQIIDMINAGYMEEIEILINDCLETGDEYDLICKIVCSALDKTSNNKSNKPCDKLTDKLIDKIAEKKKSESDIKKSNIKCVICLDQDKNILCFPCKHISSCQSCFSKNTDLLCPMCRTPIESSVTIYL